MSPAADGATIPRTLFDKVWDDHVVATISQNVHLLHVDRNLLHELSGAVSLRALDERALKIRNPELTFATLDHVLETLPERGMTTRIPGGTDFLREFAARIGPHGVRFFDLGDERQGIVHVIAPELGIVLPGMTLVCGDSHTCTVGAVGAFAFGVGTSESEHVLATQTIVQTKPKTMRVRLDGRLALGVSAKDVVLALIGRFGTAGGRGCAIEFAGQAIDAMPMAGRLTLCNMSVEFGGRTGMIAPDQVTYDFLQGRSFAPKGAAWDSAVAYWRGLASDPEAVFDFELHLDCADLSPQITWGTSPQHVVSVDGVAPQPCNVEGQGDAALERALAYMGLTPGEPIAGLAIQGAFIGSCTNGRLDDLREAALVLRGRRIPPGLVAICSPGSTAVKHAAESEGLDQIFRDAGFQWREAGCSLCVSGGMGGEAFPERARVVATTNRNFEHRQGRDVRSHLASPATVAASAVAGVISDARKIGA